MEQTCIVSSLFQNGYSAMYCAALEGHTDIVSRLIEAHGIVDLCDKVIAKECSAAL